MNEEALYGIGVKGRGLLQMAVLICTQRKPEGTPFMACYAGPGSEIDVEAIQTYTTLEAADKDAGRLRALGTMAEAVELSADLDALALKWRDKR
jgi:hypothetical protein